MLWVTSNGYPNHQAGAENVIDQNVVIISITKIA